MNDDNIDDIIKNVCSVADERKSSVPKHVFEEIIRAEFMYQDDPSRAHMAVQRIIENYLNSIKYDTGEVNYDH